MAKVKEHWEIQTERYPTETLFTLLECRESTLKRLKKGHPNRVILEERITAVKAELKRRKEI